ncbi:MAG: MlaD family protein, partial [Phycisphaerales bacterium]|nr:MlaD family protein [Phycisphaerales bacterium]
MPQLRDKQRNNVKAGIFVLFTLILGIVVIAVLTNLWEAITIKTSKYHASFKVLDGVGTLSVGSKVRLGGVSIGSISSVTPQIVNGEPIENIDVYFDINSDILLYNNVSLEVHTGLLGSQAWLSIDDVGEGDLATSESLLVGSSSTMVAQLLGSEADKNIRKTLNALQRISKSLSEDGEALRLLLGKKEADEIAIAITAAKEGLQSIQELGDGLQTVWPTWESSVSHLLTESKDLPEKLKATLMEAQKMVADIRANTLPSVEKSIVSLEATSKSLESITRSLQESSPRWTNKVNSILANVDQITSRAKLAVDDISA